MKYKKTFLFFTEAIGQLEQYLTPIAWELNLNFISGRFCEVFDSCKNSEGGDITELSELSPVILAKVVKFMLLRDRDQDLIRQQVKAEKLVNREINIFIKYKQINKSKIR